MVREGCHTLQRAPSSKGSGGVQGMNCTCKALLFPKLPSQSGALDKPFPPNLAVSLPNTCCTLKQLEHKFVSF